MVSNCMHSVPCDDCKPEEAEVEHSYYKGEKVFYIASVRGKNINLCQLCVQFYPHKPQNCGIAERLYKISTEYPISVPVTECRYFIAKR